MLPNPLRIAIHKTTLTLELWNADRCVATYPIGLGKSPEGPKTRQGDSCTPEGEYRICVKNPQSRFFLSLGLDYPNPADARRARSEGRIDAGTEARIVAAHRQGKRPPWDTPLGGEIYIHGDLEKHPHTRGCIALRNVDMKALFDRVVVGTPVWIG